MEKQLKTKDRKKYNKEYYQLNKEHFERRYVKNRLQKLEYQTKYNDANKERIRQRKANDKEYFEKWTVDNIGTINSWLLMRSMEEAVNWILSEHGKLTILQKKVIKRTLKENGVQIEF